MIYEVALIFIRKEIRKSIKRDFFLNSRTRYAEIDMLHSIERDTAMA